MYTEGAGPVCKYTGQCTVEGSAQWGVDTGVQNLIAAKIPEASFPTANLFTANFQRTVEIIFIKNVAGLVQQTIGFLAVVCVKKMLA